MSQSEFIEPCTAQRTAVVVLDGTSAAPIVAQILGVLGCDAPASEREDVNKLRQFNRTVLQSAGMADGDWAGVNTSWLASPKATEFLNRALELLQDEFDDSYICVVQDSHTARILPFWNIVFDRAGILARFIFVVSDPAELVSQGYQSPTLEDSIGQLSWLREALDAELNSRGKPRVFIRAEQLGDDPAAILSSVAKSLDLTFPRDPYKVFTSEKSRLNEFQEFLRNRKSFRNNTATAASDWVAATHQILNDWTTTGETVEGRTALDAIREAFDDAAPVFFNLGRGAASKNAKLRELEQELQALRRSSRSAEESTKEIQSTLKGRISHLESEIAQRKAEIDETEQLLKSAREQVSTLKKELQTLLNSARREADGLRKTNAQAEEQLRARYGEIVSLTRMLSSETMAARKFERNADRLGAIAQAFERGTGSGRFSKWLNSMLPWRLQFQRIKRRIEQEGLFDPEAYLRANPDVKSAGVNPLRHYLTHGASEGRPLGIE